MKRALLACLLLLGDQVEAKKAPGSVVRFEIPAQRYDGSMGMKVGSGVHLGGGFILTAEHVVHGENKMLFQLDNSRVHHNAEVLWSNYNYDIALVYAPMEDIGYSQLSCRTPEVGESLLMVGNMHGMRFTHTPGYVSNAPDEIARWKEVVAVMGANGDGMSGGPAFDKDGYVVGLVVAGPQTDTYALVVPGSAICKLLARK